MNPVIVIIVLRCLYEAASRHTMARPMILKILLLGLSFEIALILRIVLLVKQDEWKKHDRGLFISFFSFYILFGEVACQAILLYGLCSVTKQL